MAVVETYQPKTHKPIFLGHPNDFASKTNCLFSFVHSHDGPKLSFVLTLSFIDPIMGVYFHPIISWWVLLAEREEKYTPVTECIFSYK